MAHDGVVVGRVPRLQHRLVVAVGELDLAGDADDELLALVGRDLVHPVGLELDAEGIHVAIGLAEGERVGGVAEHVDAFLRDLLRLEVLGAGDDRVGLELVVHERAEAPSIPLLTARS